MTRNSFLSRRPLKLPKSDKKERPKPFPSPLIKLYKIRRIQYSFLNFYAAKILCDHASSPVRRFRISRQASLQCS